MKQASLNLNLLSKKTRKQTFLDEMEKVVPWADLEALIAPYYCEGVKGRPPFALQTMLRTHFMQQWLKQSRARWPPRHRSDPRRSRISAAALPFSRSRPICEVSAWVAPSLAGLPHPRTLRIVRSVCSSLARWLDYMVSAYNPLHTFVAESSPCKSNWPKSKTRCPNMSGPFRTEARLKSRCVAYLWPC